MTPHVLLQVPLCGGKTGGLSPAGKQTEHKGFRIEAAPYREGVQYQLAGIISKEIGGAKREHRFVRADRFQTAAEAAERALDKGRQLIDEQGDKLFG